MVLKRLNMIKASTFFNQSGNSFIFSGHLQKVADGPCRLFLSLEIGLSEMENDLWDQSSVNNCLHLVLVSSGDVRQEPHGFLVDLLLGMGEQGGKVLENSAVENDLSLLVGSSNDVSYCANCCSLNVNVGMVNELAEGRQQLLDCLNWRGRVLVAAQVHDNPCHVPEEADGNLGVDEAEKGLNHVQGNHVIAKLGSVANDVTKSPNCLLAHILMIGSQKLQKQQHSTCINNRLGLLRSSRRDVGESPSSLELQR